MDNHPRIYHDQENHRFFSNVKGKDALLQYDVLENNVLDFIFTYVPPESRRHGIAAKLVEEGLDYAKENGFHVRPSCSYVDRFVRNHKDEYTDLVAR